MWKRRSIMQGQAQIRFYGETDEAIHVSEYHYYINLQEHELFNQSMPPADSWHHAWKGKTKSKDKERTKKKRSIFGESFSLSIYCRLPHLLCTSCGSGVASICRAPQLTIPDEV